MQDTWAVKRKSGRISMVCAPSYVAAWRVAKEMDTSDRPVKVWRWNSVAALALKTQE